MELFLIDPLILAFDMNEFCDLKFVEMKCTRMQFGFKLCLLGAHMSVWVKILRERQLVGW